MDSLSSWGEVLLFIIAGLVFVLAALMVSRIIRPKRPNVEKLSSYESGEEPIGSPWAQFHTRFYVIALIFLLFEVEIAFLFPWATIFASKDLDAQTGGDWSLFALIEMIIFIAVLALGLGYAWSKGHLDWIKSEPRVTDFKSNVPMGHYQRFNERYKSKSKE